MAALENSPFVVCYWLVALQHEFSLFFLQDQTLENQVYVSLSIWRFFFFSCTPWFIEIPRTQYRESGTWQPPRRRNERYKSDPHVRISGITGVCVFRSVLLSATAAAATATTRTNPRGNIPCQRVLRLSVSRYALVCESPNRLPMSVS